MLFDLRNIDCMQLMREYPDKYFDLAIVDPPYGMNIAATTNYGESGGSDGRWNTTKKDFHTAKDWDKNIPTAEYFAELKRVSKNQIVWGWNYFAMHFDNCPSYIVWNKEASGNYSDCELAWCSIKGTNKIFKWLWNGFRKQQPEERTHPTQKPKQLYKWCLKNYAKEGDKILDTHLGSGTIALALDDMNKVDRMNLTLTGSEIDTEYYTEMIERIKNETQQNSLFSI